MRLTDMFTVLDEIGLCEKFNGVSRKIYLNVNSISVWLNLLEEDVKAELDILEDSKKIIQVEDEGCIVVKDIEEARRFTEGLRLMFKN